MEQIASFVPLLWPSWRKVRQAGGLSYPTARPVVTSCQVMPARLKGFG